LRQKKSRFQNQILDSGPTTLNLRGYLYISGPNDYEIIYFRLTYEKKFMMSSEKIKGKEKNNKNLPLIINK